MRQLFAFSFLVLFAATSCKHVEKASTSSSYQPPATADAPRPDGMTAGKASEEEIFVQGCIEKALGNNRKALVQFQECLSMNPKSAAANYEVAGLYQQMGQADRALKYAKDANDIAPENRWYKQRYAELLQENNQHEQAVKIFKELSDLEPKNTDLLFRYATALQKADKADEALKVYDRIESIEGISDTLTTSRVAIYKSKNDIVSEENALVALAKAFPEEIKYQERLAEFYKSNNMPSKAADTYKQMAARFPGIAGPHLLLSSYYNDANQPDKTFSEAALAFEIPAGPIEPKIALMRTLYPCTDASPSLSPSKRKEADSLCRILRRVYPNAAAAFTISGDYLYKDGKLKEARDFYHKAATLGQDEYASWKRLMEINDKLKDNVAQEKDCKQVQELFPTQPEAYYYLGMIQYNKKDYKNAIDNLESAKDYLNDDPKLDFQIKLLLIDAYRTTGKNEKADSYCDDVIAVDSTNFPLIAAYCNSLSERKTRLYKAEQLMLKLVQKEGGNASYMEILGWIEYGLHDYKMANQWMSSALAKMPDNAQVNERMGDIQYHLGNANDALKYWKKAKEKGGSNPLLEKKINTETLEETE